MIVETDIESGAEYIKLRDGIEVARTHSVSDLVMVDLDSDGVPIGIELVTGWSALTEERWLDLVNAYPTLKEPLRTLAEQRRYF